MSRAEMYVAAFAALCVIVMVSCFVIEYREMQERDRRIDIAADQVLEMYREQFKVLRHNSR